MSMSLKRMRVGILGGGITGLTSAFYLLRAGADVTVIEARPQLGGLATYFNFGPFCWDKFYHCILTSDQPLLKLIDDLGLTPELRWTETKVGFFADNVLHPMTSSLDFLRFPPLNLWQKLRLGLGVLRVTRIKDGRPLEKYLASDWLTSVFGQANYQKMWGPLLKCKLGACREEASAAFIWATISRLYSTREKDTSKKEKLGYVCGGYHTVIKRLIEEIENHGGRILTGHPVKRIVKLPNSTIEINTRLRDVHCEAAIATVPSPVLAGITPQLAPEYVTNLMRIKYLGIVCYVLVLKRRLSPYYVTNLTDEGLPFTGIIEMSNLISSDETNGYHLVYLPKYTSPGDPLFEALESDIWTVFWKALKQVFPDLKEEEIAQKHLFRERFVQPVPVLNYSDIVPAMKTNVEGLLLANTTQIINSTLNNNAMVKIANRAVELTTDNRHGGDLVRKELLASKAAASCREFPSSDLAQLPRA
jgi:protoporphyrinogen oxidase